MGDMNGCDSLGSWYRKQGDRTSGLLVGSEDPAGEFSEVTPDERARSYYEKACDDYELRGCLNLVNLDLGIPLSRFGETKPTLFELRVEDVR